MESCDTYYLEEMLTKYGPQSLLEAIAFILRDYKKGKSK